MYRLKKAANKKKSPFLAVVPKGMTLVSVLTSPKAIVDRLKKNNKDMKKVFSNNNN